MKNKIETANLLADHFEKKWKEEAKFTRVIVDVFKDTGKFNYREEYLSNIQCHDTDLLVKEAKEKVSGESDFTIEMKQHSQWNKYLVKKVLA